jgi:hypothetical protein
MEKDITKKSFQGSPIASYGNLVPSDVDPMGKGNPELKTVYEEIEGLKERLDEIITLLRNNGIS